MAAIETGDAMRQCGDWWLQAEVATRFLALKDLVKRNGQPYIVSITGGTAISKEGLEQAFVVTFKNEEDRNYFVGKPYSDTMDPAHEALVQVVVPLIAADNTGKPTGLFKTVVVVAGSSLSDIARTEYGSLDLWPLIHDLNKSKIGPNPNLIAPGLSLSISPLTNYTAEQIAWAKHRASTWRQFQ